MAELDKRVYNAKVAVARLNKRLEIHGLRSEIEYTGNVGGIVAFEIEFKCIADSFMLRGSYYDEIMEAGFKLRSTYIDWGDNRFVVQLEWSPRYVSPMTDEEIETARRMAEAMESALNLRRKLDVNVDYIGSEDGKPYFKIIFKPHMMNRGDDIEISGGALDHIRNHMFGLESIKIDMKGGFVAFNLVWEGT